jgi:hypothetical protein
MSQEFFHIFNPTHDHGAPLATIAFRENEEDTAQAVLNVLYDETGADTDAITLEPPKNGFRRSVVWCREPTIFRYWLEGEDVDLIAFKASIY